MTRKIPFAEKTRLLEIENAVRGGEKPEIPDNIPDEVRNIIYQSLSLNEEERPTAMNLSYFWSNFSLVGRENVEW